MVILVEETFVAVTFVVSMEVPAVMRVEERFAAERLVPVAFVKVAPVEETFVETSVPRFRFVPVAFTKVMPVEEAKETLMLVPVAFVKRSPGMVEVV